MMELVKCMFYITSLICFADIIIPSNGERNVELGRRLESLRNLMGTYNISAYIIPNEDDHQSEETALADKRREYISGFTGTAGLAIITLNNATLWTDDRYYLQAEVQLPPMWTLERRVMITDIKKWLREYIKEGERVGIDPKKIIPDAWNQLEETLNERNIQLVALDNNLIDEIWENRPKYSKDPLFVHDIKYCGITVEQLAGITAGVLQFLQLQKQFIFKYKLKILPVFIFIEGMGIIGLHLKMDSSSITNSEEDRETYESKLKRLKHHMNSSKWDVLVVTALDEIAWLFNLRGNDLPYSPLFLAYALITSNSATLYVDQERITRLVKEHLNKSEMEVRIKSYNEFWNDLSEASNTTNKIYIPSKSSYAVHLKVPKNMTYVEVSPIRDMKAVKNEIEVEGSRKAHIRDSVAICSLFKLMEEEVPKGVHWDEIKVASVLDELRKKYGENVYKGPSFKTQVAFGKHSAMPHYTSQPNTNAVINSSSSMTIDSGGQYLDGTIDTTRVIHFGTPTEFQKNIYTSLLEGVVDLADTVFPQGISIDSLEILLRRPLLKLGLTFGHGTVHGTGIFSSVHEGCNRTYFENFIGSQEPGYYLRNQFGMRLENLLVVVKAEVQNEYNRKPLLAFSPLTLVPYEKKLMNLNSLDFRQIAWINNYHEIIKKYVGKQIIILGRNDLYDWLSEKTKPITFPKHY